MQPDSQHGDSRNNLNIVEAPVGNVLIRTGGRRSGRGRNGVRQGTEDQSGGGVSRGVGISSDVEMRNNVENTNHSNRNVNEEVNELDDRWFTTRISYKKRLINKINQWSRQ